MLSELATIREHWVRYREVTLQQLDMLAEEHLAWRPQPALFSVGQHFVHILQTEKYFALGLFHRDWDTARLHFPAGFRRSATCGATSRRLAPRRWPTSTG